MFTSIFTFNTHPLIDKKEEEYCLYDTTFQLPIFYLNNKHKLSSEIIKDLEFINTQNKEEQNEYHDGIYKILFDVKNGEIFKNQLLKKWSEYYTTDTDFIEQTINIIKSPLLNDKEDNKLIDQNILTIWKDLKNDEYFLEKYSYMEWSYLENWNNSPLFLWLYSCINILSPLLTLLIPFIFFIFPVILMIIFYQPFTFESYFIYLKELSKHHFVGNMIGIFDGSVEFSWDKIIGALVSILFYGISIYQNIIGGFHFYNNIKLVNEHLITLRNYLSFSDKRIKQFLNIVKINNSDKYNIFVNELNLHQNIILSMQKEVDNVSEFVIDFKKCSELGNLLCSFYQFHKNPIYEKSLRYILGFNSYYDCLLKLNNQYDNNNINPCKFVKEKNNVLIEKQYYPFLDKSISVTNNLKLNKNIILTGCNGCGKSTIMKTTLINIILSQQIGFGFYENMNIIPYDNFHCYLNIIDTGATNDSLFMAQSRKSKEIMEIIEKGNSHFCILDEIFCGTEIESCTNSCIAFINELLKNNKCTFILSTHITKICKTKFKKNNVINCMMKVIENNDDIKNTYKIVPGISNIKGALNVFKNMNFPSDFVNYIRDNKNKQKV